MPELMVHVIEGDEHIRGSLASLLSASNISVQTYPSAEAFLAVARKAKGVVVTDIGMLQVEGLEFIRRLKARGIALAVIVVTRHGGVPLAVEAMKAGALDVIEKPFDDAILVDAIRAALAGLGGSQSQESEREEIRQRIRSLSRRERQVLDGLVAGRLNRLIADDLQLSVRTVEVYRATMLAKMQAASVPDLVRMALLGGIAP